MIWLALYSLTFSVIIVDQLGRLNGQLKSFMADALMMLMMAYIVCIILQCIVLSDAKHQKNTRQILVTSQALEASDKLKNESEEQARKLSLAARHSNDSVIISDTYRRISWMKEAFSKITGYTRSEAIGRTPPDLLNDEATDLEASKKIAQHIQAGDPIRAEVLNKRKDGEKVWVETNIVPVKLD
ncbi:MAG: PAS domain S-box protein, partial [Planktotalea sp.]|uniref:PAS domain-containing protein n=1 Tax=Planktotalea sp. TaxID=2029877 RepID=UPI002616BDA4